MLRHFALVGCLALLLGTAGAVLAQTSQPASRPAPGSTPGISNPQRGSRMMEGKLKRVEGSSETVVVSVGPLGLLGKTFEVNSDTQIEVEGREARFADLREGARAKVFYEERNGRSVATRIEVMPEAQRGEGPAAAGPFG